MEIVTIVAEFENNLRVGLLSLSVKGRQFSWEGERRCTEQVLDYGSCCVSPVLDCETLGSVVVSLVSACLTGLKANGFEERV
jgi:hypothetical protein